MISEDVYEWARDKAEAEYFAHVEELPITTHIDPLEPILVGNEPTSEGNPF